MGECVGRRQENDVAPLDSRPSSSRNQLVVPGSSATIHHILYESTDVFYHVGQQSSKVLDDNNRLARLSHEMRRRAEITRQRGIGRKLHEISMVHEVVDPTKVSLTLQIDSAEYREMFRKGLLASSKESIASIMADTQTLIRFPDRDETNPDLIHQVSIAGTIADVEQARIRLRGFCVVHLVFPIITLPADMPMSQLCSWLQDKCKDGTLVYPQLAIQVMPPSLSMIFKDSPTIRVTGRLSDHTQMLEAVSKLKDLFFDAEVAKTIYCCTQIDVPSNQRNLIFGGDNPQQLLNISKATDSLLHFPAHVPVTPECSVMTVFISGQAENILLARKYVQALQPIQLCFDVDNDDLLCPLDEKAIPFEHFDQYSQVFLRVMLSERQPITTLPADRLTSYFCLTTNEYNVRGLYSAYSRTLKRAATIPIPSPNDYDFMMPVHHLLADPSRHLDIRNRMDPRPLILPCEYPHTTSRVKRQSDADRQSSSRTGSSSERISHSKSTLEESTKLLNNARDISTGAVNRNVEEIQHMFGNMYNMGSARPSNYQHHTHHNYDGGHHLGGRPFYQHRDHFGGQRPYRGNYSGNNNFNHRGRPHHQSNGDKRRGSGYRGPPRYPIQSGSLPKSELNLKHRNGESFDERDRYYQMNDSGVFERERRFEADREGYQRQSNNNSHRRPLLGGGEVNSAQGGYSNSESGRSSARTRSPVTRDDKDIVRLQNRSPHSFAAAAVIGCSNNASTDLDNSLNDSRRMSAMELIMMAAEEPQSHVRSRQMKESDDVEETREVRSRTYAEILEGKEKKRSNSAKEEGEADKEDTNSERERLNAASRRSYSSACMSVPPPRPPSEQSHTSDTQTGSMNIRTTRSAVSRSSSHSSIHTSAPHFTNSNLNFGQQPAPAVNSSAHCLPLPVPEICHFLSAIRCEQYIDVFLNAKIDFPSVLRMNDSEMRLIGINSEAARKTILSSIQMLRHSVSGNY